MTLRRIMAAAILALGAATAIAATPSPASGTAGPYRSVTIHERHAGQLRAVSPSAIPRTHLADPRPRAGTILSGNWSGYVDQACGSCHLRYVAADFTLPRLNCATSPDQSWWGGWVGLDGWEDGTVEQTGITADCAAGAGNYFVFTEMFPSGPVVYQVAALPGDNLAVSVYFDQSTGLWSLSVDDTTIGASVDTSAGCPTGASCLNKSAEVVSEAPCCTATGAPLALADFGQVNYTGGRVTSYNGTRGGLCLTPLWTSFNVSIADTAGVIQATAGPLVTGTAGGIPVSDFASDWLAST